MKKFSTEHFEKKYRTLYEKLLCKEGFLNDIKSARKTLVLPEEGFSDEYEFAYHIIHNMNDDELFHLTFFIYLDHEASKNREAFFDLDKEGRAPIIDAFIKSYNKKKERLELISKAVFELGRDIVDHNQMIQLNPNLKGSRIYTKLSRETSSLLQKYWGLDLLDEHIFGHLVEKHLFLDKYGVNKYIKEKTTCPMCKYIGVTHFSPERNHIDGEMNGTGKKKYRFNKNTVDRLSLHFNSVFLIIKPYATKEETIQYIEDNWDCLKDHIIEKNTYYKQFEVNPSKIKTSDLERNKLVYELYKLSKKEVLKRYKGEDDFSGKYIYKETIISAILGEQYDIKMTADAVKKSASRFAKSIKIKKEPKDIRDI